MGAGMSTSYKAGRSSIKLRCGEVRQLQKGKELLKVGTYGCGKLRANRYPGPLIWGGSLVCRWTLTVSGWQFVDRMTTWCLSYQTVTKESNRTIELKNLSKYKWQLVLWNGLLMLRTTLAAMTSSACSLGGTFPSVLSKEYSPLILHHCLINTHFSCRNIMCQEIVVTHINQGPQLLEWIIVGIISWCLLLWILQMKVPTEIVFCNVLYEATSWLHAIYK